MQHDGTRLRAKKCYKFCNNVNGLNKNDIRCVNMWIRNDINCDMWIRNDINTVIKYESKMILDVLICELEMILTVICELEMI